MIIIPYLTNNGASSPASPQLQFFFPSPMTGSKHLNLDKESVQFLDLKKAFYSVSHAPPIAGQTSLLWIWHSYSFMNYQLPHQLKATCDSRQRDIFRDPSFIRHTTGLSTGTTGFEKRAYFTQRPNLLLILHGCNSYRLKTNHYTTLAVNFAPCSLPVWVWLFSYSAPSKESTFSEILISAV